MQKSNFSVHVFFFGTQPIRDKVILYSSLPKQHCFLWQLAGYIEIRFQAQHRLEPKLRKLSFR